MIFLEQCYCLFFGVFLVLCFDLVHAGFKYSHKVLVHRFITSSLPGGLTAVFWRQKTSRPRICGSRDSLIKICFSTLPLTHSKFWPGHHEKARRQQASRKKNYFCTEDAAVFCCSAFHCFRASAKALLGLLGLLKAAFFLSSRVAFVRSP